MNIRNVYYNISSTQGLQPVIKYPVAYFKGSTTVTFVLTGINEETDDVLFLEIDWGDGTSKEYYQKDLIFNYKEESIFNEILYGKIGGSIATFYDHIYFNNTSNYNIALSSQFLFTFSSGATLLITQPISIFKNSYYDEIGDLNLLSTQVTPTSSNFTFVNFEGKNNRQTYVGIMSTN